MNLCQDHWDALREAVEDRGMEHLVSNSPHAAVKRLTDILMKPDSIGVPGFDPLIWSWALLVERCMHIISSSGGNALYLLDAYNDEAPVEGYPGYEGETWPRCCVCYLNLAHELTCEGGDCKLELEDGFDFLIGKASDRAEDKAKELGLLHETGEQDG